MCSPSASTHLNVTRLVFISLCSACGGKISRFKWYLWFVFPWNNVRHHSYHLYSDKQRLRTRYTGRIEFFCIFERDYLCLSVRHHSFLAVSFPMAPSTQCSPHVYWILSCIWASNRASPTETHAKHFRSIRANSVVSLWMQVEMPNLFSWVKLWVFTAKILCKYVNCILLNTILIMHLNQYLHFHKLSCSYSKLF